MVGALLPLIKVQSIFPEQNFLQAKLKLIGGLANVAGCMGAFQIHFVAAAQQQIAYTLLNFQTFRDGVYIIVASKN